MLAAGLLLGLAACGAPGSAGAGGGSATPRPVPSASATPTPQTVLSPPTRLGIASIGVNAPVEAVGVDSEGRMATPSSPDRVAWYQPGAAPGQAGDAVIDGHLDWTDGPAVFWHLDQVKTGDQIMLTGQSGQQLRFVVDATWTIDADHAIDPLFTMSGPPSVSLITCTGAWDVGRATYQKRLIVHATEG